jgi:hypothetical protein
MQLRIRIIVIVISSSDSAVVILKVTNNETETMYVLRNKDKVIMMYTTLVHYTTI